MTEAGVSRVRRDSSTSAFLSLLDRGVADTKIRFLIDGEAVDVGRGNARSPVAIRVHQQRMFARTLSFGNLGLGESYIDEDFEVESGTLHEFLTILLRNRLQAAIRGDWRLALRVLWTRLVGIWRGVGGNVRRHYDIGDELFEVFLDSSLTYSCGYARSPDDDLEALQRQKLERICQKLCLAPGLRMVDIGCGYGGLLIHAARHHGVRGTGVTLSRRHSERARAEVDSAGLADQISIQYGDFESVGGAFDRLVSVGMMEHLAPGDYGRYFKTVAARVQPTGLGLLHTIGSTTRNSGHDPFIQKYIFPASHQPRLSRIADGLERHGLAILDVENLKCHYGHTTLRWLEKFQERQHELDASKYDRPFRRLWLYYLSCGIAAGFASDAAVFQVLFTPAQTTPVRLHRV
jgi:cyclopropane-fatty-acyl-phospholipid synthase